MKPEVLIVVSGGVVEDVESNLPGIEITINDTDQQGVGEPYTSTFEAGCVTPDGGQPGTPLSEAELERFDREMQANSTREEAQALGHFAINPEHLLLGLLREEDVASRLLNDVGVTLDGARRLTAELTETNFCRV